jgi:chromate transporter
VATGRDAAPASGGPPPFRVALACWARIGWISFGGPAGQIALMHRELVERRRWIGDARFLHAVNFCMLLPGPEAQQLATYIGWTLHGARGALAAGLLFIFPSVAVLWALAAIYVTWGTVPLVLAILAGVKPTVVALVAHALVRLGRRALRHPLHVGLAGGAFVALSLHVPFPAVVAAAAGLGLVAGRRAREFAAPPAGGAESDAEVECHGRAPSLRSTLMLIALFIGLWIVPFAFVAGPLEGSLPIARGLYLFFTRAAFVTFGGAYAVLAYVAEVATSRFGWLTPGEMIDGLALAETTPGPLIMVLQFVGFLAGWRQPGNLSPLAAASLGAFVTTWATFLPCFAFILVGAPYIDALRGRPALASALAGVTAAAVGVILHLAVVFGRDVLLPSGEIDVTAAAMALGALALLLRSTEAHRVVLAGALAGLVLGAFGT